MHPVTLTARTPNDAPSSLGATAELMPEQPFMIERIIFDPRHLTSTVDYTQWPLPPYGGLPPLPAPVMEPLAPHRVVVEISFTNQKITLGTVVLSTLGTRMKMEGPWRGLETGQVIWQLPTPIYLDKNEKLYFKFTGANEFERLPSVNAADPTPIGWQVGIGLQGFYMPKHTRRTQIPQVYGWFPNTSAATYANNHSLLSPKSVFQNNLRKIMDVRRFVAHDNMKAENIYDQNLVRYGLPTPNAYDYTVDHATDLLIRATNSKNERVIKDFIPFDHVFNRQTWSWETPSARLYPNEYFQFEVRPVSWSDTPEQFCISMHTIARL